MKKKLIFKFLGMACAVLISITGITHWLAPVDARSSLPNASPLVGEHRAQRTSAGWNLIAVDYLSDLTVINSALHFNRIVDNRVSDFVGIRDRLSLRVWDTTTQTLKEEAIPGKDDLGLPGTNHPYELLDVDGVNIVVVDVLNSDYGVLEAYEMCVFRGGEATATRKEGYATARQVKCDFNSIEASRSLPKVIGAHNVK